ncbi:MAG: beta-ketoacyl-ACP synthase III [Acidimicrobiales bacterium]
MTGHPQGAALLGFGGFRPERSVTNEEVCERVDSSDEWIRTRTGITARGWAGPEETLETMAVSAAKGALQDAGEDPTTLDMVLVATCTNGQSLQPLAPRVATAVGSDCGALDINATCAGFCYGLGLARDLVSGGTARQVLVVGAERLSDVTDPTDRGTAFIFADGAGAALVGRSFEEKIGPVVWGSDGARGETLRLVPEWTQHAADPGLGRPAIRMEGRRVFKWAAEEMPRVALAACKAAGVDLGDIDVLVPHQANQRITDIIAEGLDLAPGVVVADDIATTGNTSSASIPLAIHRMRCQGRLRGGERALLIGFGGGLSFAAQVVVLP